MHTALTHQLSHLLSPPTRAALLSSACLAAGLCLGTGCTAGIGASPDGEAAAIGGGPGQGGNDNGAFVCSFNSDSSTAAIVGSGQLVTRTFAVSGFQAVEGIDCRDSVVIQRGDTFAVSVEVDDNIAPFYNATVDVENGALVLGLAAGSYQDFAAKVTITMPTLSGVEAAGRTSTVVTGFASQAALAIDLSDLALLTGDISAGDTVIVVDDAAEVSLSGAAVNLVLDAQGASNVDLAMFPSTTVNVDMTDIAQAIIHVNGALGADLSGKARLRYTGNPQSTSLRVSGAASVSRL